MVDDAQCGAVRYGALRCGVRRCATVCDGARRDAVGRDARPPGERALHRGGQRSKS